MQAAVALVETRVVGQRTGIEWTAKWRSSVGVDAFPQIHSTATRKETQMKRLNTILSSMLLGVAVVASSPSFAQTSPLSADAIRKMDLNKDGRLTKDEYLKAMTAVFDAHAGPKGYCTPEEAQQVMRSIQDYSFLNKYNP